MERGLNFTPAPSRLPVQDIIAENKPVLRYHNDKAAANVARAAACNILRKAKPPPTNITREEKQALKALKLNADIVIAKADKGNATVVMDKIDYERKTLAILENSPFRRIAKNPTKNIERKINARLQALRRRGSIDSDLYNTLRVSQNCTRPALFYGLPKIHKPDVPIRPIVSYVNHALYNTAKHLASLLSPFSKTMSSFVKNSAHLCEILQDVTIDENEVLVSFDVKS